MPEALRGIAHDRGHRRHKGVVGIRPVDLLLEAGGRIALHGAVLARDHHLTRSLIEVDAVSVELLDAGVLARVFSGHCR